VGTEAPKSIGEAINDFTEDDVPGDEPEVADEVADNTDVGEGTPEGADEEDETDETELETAAEGEEEDEGEFPDKQEASAEEDEEDEVEEPEADDFFEQLTSDDIQTIKDSPELTKVRRLLMRGYNKKMEGRTQDLRMVDGYKADPLGMLAAMAQAHGYQLVTPKAPPGEAGEAGEEPGQEEKVAAARAKVEKLFGAAGQEVRTALDDYVEVMTGMKVGPLQETLGRVVSDSEDAKMQSEEDAWRLRNKNVLTPELEQAVVELGNTGKYIPGPNAKPGEFLDDLLEIAKAKHGVVEEKKQTVTASKKLARRIEKAKRSREPGGVSSKAKVATVSRLIEDPGSFNNLGEAIDFADGELSQE
jgi:hypothetical protein